MGLVASACSHTPEPATAGDPAPPEVIYEVEPTPAPDIAAAPSSNDPKHAFVVIYEAVRNGDWPALEPFVGAAPIHYVRAGSLGDDPPEDRSIAADQAQAWLAELQLSWAPECMDNPEPPCLTLNPLSLGVDDPSELELRCGGPGPTDVGVTCCRHEPPLLHNTPFLVDVCFDEGMRLTQLSILDG